jgi:hypothetical protein
LSVLPRPLTIAAFGEDHDDLNILGGDRGNEQWED